MNIKDWKPVRLSYFILLFWSVSLLLELVFIGHYEDWLQWLPLASIPLFVAVSSLGSQKKIWMQLFCGYLIVLGVLGIILHLQNNLEFEREMYPSLGGWELLSKSFTGALPVLAPGSLIPLGLLGLLLTKLKNQ